MEDHLQPDDAAARAGIPVAPGVDEPHRGARHSGSAGAVTADEEGVAAARRSSIEAGRRSGGIAGAALAASMLALRDIYEGPPRDQLQIEIDAASDPHDIDRDGISLSVDGVAVHAPPRP